MNKQYVSKLARNYMAAGALIVAAGALDGKGNRKTLDTLVKN